MSETISNIVAKHTPGPWRIQGLKPDPHVFRIFGPDKLSERTPLLADVWDSEANARLIAAAPDLLAALLALAMAVVDDEVDIGLIEQADAAIAKAKGRS